jgi:hypothetical protein
MDIDRSTLIRASVEAAVVLALGWAFLLLWCYPYLITQSTIWTPQSFTAGSFVAGEWATVPGASSVRIRDCRGTTWLHKITYVEESIDGGQVRPRMYTARWTLKPASLTLAVVASAAAVWTLAVVLRQSKDRRHGRPHW